MSDKRLYRSRDDKMISGVAGGIADYFDMDPTIVRLAWVAVTLLTSGVMVLIYIIMAIVVPEAPAEGEPHDPRAMSADDVSRGAQAFGNDVSDAARRYTKTGAATGAAGAAVAVDAEETPAAATPAGDVTDSAAAATPEAAPASEQTPSTLPPASPPPTSSTRERRGSGGLIVGGILVLVGIALLLERVTGIDVWSFFNFGWRFILPALVIAFGVLVIVRAIGRR